MRRPWRIWAIQVTLLLLLSSLLLMHGPKTGGCCASSFFRGGDGSPSNTMSPGPRRISVPSGILIHQAVWPQQTGWKLGDGAMPPWGSWVPISQCCLGRSLPPHQVASRSIQPFGHDRHGPKTGGLLCPFLVGGAGSPSNTMWPGLRPTSAPSFILIHPTVWPQYTNVTMSMSMSLSIADLYSA